MPIHEGILKNYGKEFVIVLKGDQTLADAIQRLAESGYSESNSYLVVEPVKPAGEPYQTSDQYLVIPFRNLYELLQTKDSLAQPLTTFPFPAAMRVERKDTSESGKSIGDWVRTTPRSTLVVIDDGGFVALLGNTDMTAGGIRQGSILAKASLMGGKGECPLCEENKGEGFDFEGTMAKCKACKKSFEVKA